MLTAVLFIIGCKHPEPDYRDQWTGFYDCKVCSHSSIGSTEEHWEVQYVDTLVVLKEADSVVKVYSLINTGNSWMFRVDPNGEFREIGTNYYPYYGLFFQDSIEINYFVHSPNVVQRKKISGKIFITTH